MTVLTRAELALAALALVAAAVTGEVMLVAFAAPLVLALAVGLLPGAPGRPGVRTKVEPAVVAVGDVLTVTLEVVAPARQSALVELEVPAGLEARGPARRLLELRRGVPERLTFELVAARPGRFRLGTARVSLGTPSRLLERSFVLGEEDEVEARPATARLGSLVRSARVRGLVGDRVSPLGSEGIEFADVREATAPIVSRRVNWRATARRQATCVNVYHPERSTDVVLLVDTFSASALPTVVTAAINLADAYLARHDRLALVCFGGVLDWVEPGTGPLHRERVRRALLESETFFSYAWKTADVIPRRLLPAGALVLALSPLADGRFNAAVLDLRSRGVDVAVLEVVIPPALQERLLAQPSGRLAGRLLALEQEELRLRFAAWGVPVVELGSPQALGVALTRLAEIRRRATSGPRAATLG